jgi:hypothetical protein
MESNSPRFLSFQAMWSRMKSVDGHDEHGNPRDWWMDMAIQEKWWPLTHKGLRSLLGLANYYHHFIPIFSKVSRTFSDLLK